MPTLAEPSLANVSRVTDRLYVGGDLSYDETTAVAQLQELEDLGITHIVDVRLEWSDLDALAQSAPQIGYLHHGMDDAGQAVPYEWFERAVSWVEEAGAEAVVLAHCHMGINRGPSLGFAILLAQGWDPVEAITAIRKARPCANVWYAADALTWHQQRTGVDAATAAEQHAALESWREENPLDVVRIIREPRARGF